MNAYEAREEQPIRIDVAGRALYTTPLTSGGLTVLQALASLPEKLYDDPLRRMHARLEALRLAWQDRLTLFGDPRFVKVPVEKLLSSESTRRAAARIHAAVEAGRALDLPERAGNASGTIHITAADAQGNMAALTLTHGDGFGACVTVPSLGLTLGHGMSRFEDTPGHPNAIGPRKRPLHNMCPVVVCEHGRPVLALGGTGGRRIPNAIFDVLTNVLVDGMTLAGALAAPRMNTLGGRQLILTPNWNPAGVERLRAIGFSPVNGSAADVKAVHLRQRSGATAC
jgi:gamma-glutamyltranspeptidase/glutathione hydrolase